MVTRDVTAAKPKKEVLFVQFPFLLLVICTLLGLRFSHSVAFFRFYPHRKEKATRSMDLVSKPALITNRIDAFSPLGSEVFAEDLDPWRKWILNPQSDIVSIWNCVFLTSCLIVLFIDPLHLYLRVLENNNTMCIKLNKDLVVSITFLRTLADLFYTLNIAVKYRTAYVAPSSRVFGRGELVMDGKKIAKRYLKSDFALDVAVALPIPQVNPFPFSIDSVKSQELSLSPELILIIYLRRKHQGYH